MNRYIHDDHCGVEVGSGAGFSREFIRNRNYELTDFAGFDWLDQRNVDATRLPYASASLDFIIESNMLHHLSSPTTFLREAYRVLRPGGVLLIQDVWGSLLLRVLLPLAKNGGLFIRCGRV